jgi:hypothetical protein
MQPREIAGGAAQVGTGLFEMASPLIPGAAAAAPLPTAAALARGTVADYLVKKGLTAAGVPQEYADLAGVVSAALAGGKPGAEALSRLHESLGSPEVRFGRFEEPTPFSEMTDQELVDHANTIEREQPKNYNWQKEQIVKEVTRRQAARGMGPGEQAPPEQPSPAPEGPPAAPAQPTLFDQPVITDSDIAGPVGPSPEASSAAPAPARPLVPPAVGQPPATAPASAAELGKSLMPEIMTLAEPGVHPDPERMTEPQRRAYETLRAAYQTAQQQGWDPNEVSRAALTAAWGRYPDAEDVQYMHETFLNPAQEQAPQVSRETPQTEPVSTKPTQVPPPVGPRTPLWPALPPQEPAVPAKTPSAKLEPYGQEPSPEHDLSAGDTGREGGQGAAVSEYGPPDVPAGGVGGGGVTGGAETSVLIPGARNSLQARYRIVPLSQLTPSHHGFSFQPNEKYPYTNERDYTKPEPQSRVMQQAMEFEPRYLINNNPDAVNGPPVTDRKGNVFGGNSRAMTIQRVYAMHPEHAEAYVRELERQAPLYGIDPAEVRNTHQPVLVRETNVPEEQAKQVISQLNKTGTAALSPGERAISDSQRVSPETLERMQYEIEKLGEDGTLGKALAGEGGPAILDRLVQDGLITDREAPEYLGKDNKLTPEAKTRIGRLMIGRFFDNVLQYEETPQNFRNKLEKVVGPLASLEGRPEWDLFNQPIREAIRIIHEAQARGISKFEDLNAQQGLYGQTKYSPEGMAWAYALKNNSGKALGNAFRRFSELESASRPGVAVDMFGPEPVSLQEAYNEAIAPLKAGKGTTIGKAIPEVGAPEPVAAMRAAPRPRLTTMEVPRGEEVARYANPEEGTDAVVTRAPDGQHAVHLVDADDNAPLGAATYYPTRAAAEAHAQDLSRQSGLVDKGAMREAMEQARQDQAERERLERPQFGQGWGTRLWPAEQSGLFDTGPEQESLFARRASPDEVAPSRSIPEVQQILHNQTKGRAIKPDAPDAVKKHRIKTQSRKELKLQLAKSQNGGGWYADDTQVADNDLARAFPELKRSAAKRILLKAMSASISSNQNPQQEAYQSTRLWAAYRKAGLIPLAQESGQKWPGQGATVALQKIQRLLDHFGAKRDLPRAEKRVAQFLTSEHDAADIRALGRALGYTTGTVTTWIEARDRMMGAAVLGNKFSRYFAGIAGIQIDGTPVDVWMMRMHRRQLGQLLDKNGNPNEAPPPITERRLFMQVHEELAQEFGLQPEMVQSLLWHYEQDLYRSLGASTTTYKRSDGTLKYLEENNVDHAYTEQRHREQEDSELRAGAPQGAEQSGGRGAQSLAEGAVRGGPTGDAEGRGPSGAPSGPQEVAPLEGRSRSRDQLSLDFGEPAVTTKEDTRQAVADAAAGKPRPHLITVNPDTIFRFHDPLRPSVGTDATIQRFLGQAGFFLTKVGEVPTILMNQPGMDVTLSGRGIWAPDRTAEKVLGMAFRPDEWQRVLISEVQAHERISQGQGREQDRAMLRLGAHIRQALGMPSLQDQINRTQHIANKHAAGRYIASEWQSPRFNRPIIVAQSGSTLNDAELKSVIEEEYDHIQHMGLRAECATCPFTSPSRCRKRVRRRRNWPGATTTPRCETRAIPSV